MLRIVAVALVCAIIIIFLKNNNSELTIPATICSGILILYLGVSYVYESVEIFRKLIDLSGVNSSFIKIIFKITAIGYIVEFGAGVIDDFGLKSLSDKLVFIGKILIIVVSMPIFYAIINLITGLIS